MGILEGVTSQDKAHHSTGVEEKDTYLTKSKTIFIELYITVSSLRNDRRKNGRKKGQTVDFIITDVGSK